MNERREDREKRGNFFLSNNNICNNNIRTKKFNLQFSCDAISFIFSSHSCIHAAHIFDLTAQKIEF